MIVVKIDGGDDGDGRDETNRNRDKQTKGPLRRQSVERIDWESARMGIGGMMKDQLKGGMTIKRRRSKETPSCHNASPEMGRRRR